MYDRILVAVDRSDVAERVVDAARELASLSNGEVWVLHLWEKEVMPRAGTVATEADAEAHAAVQHAVQELVDAGLNAHAELRHTLYGHAAPEIVEAARAHEAGVIVMGSRGRSDLAGLVLGSTAHKVIHLTDRPVLVVR